ncbi:MAG: gspE [Chlamydiales bacterium]|jgi:general secretion pathway protein E|nr:gspE [Chlamydiales bacterium]
MLSDNKKGIKEAAGEINQNLNTTNIYTICPKIYKIACQLPYNFVFHRLVFPISTHEETLIVAMTNIYDIYTLNQLQNILKLPIIPVYKPKEEILTIINRFYEQQRIETSSTDLLVNSEQLQLSSNPVFHLQIPNLLDQPLQDSPIVNLVNTILKEAILKNVSDIHIEPSENDVHIRYRIDGLLQLQDYHLKNYYEQFIVRLKVMAQLDITETRLPQDGRMKISLGSKAVDLRISTIPCINGERIVIRILDSSKLKLELNHLAMPVFILNRFKKSISQPNGMILVTGPTGSGKTTTLYSAIAELDKSSLNIMTIEDPVEYKLAGISQTSVHPKINFNFATGLRHLLRQDPDVIMVGEIRDRETAEIAIQAALTGHLVLSTLHTSDAPTAITRLIDMGIEPHLITSAIKTVLAQRLLRKSCLKCPQEGECNFCHGTEYSGRQAIYELMEISPLLQRKILQGCDAIDLKTVAITEGMTPLLEQGLSLVQQGLTSKEELLRVLGEN